LKPFDGQYFCIRREKYRKGMLVHRLKVLAKPGRKDDWIHLAKNMKLINGLRPFEFDLLHAGYITNRL